MPPRGGDGTGEVLGLVSCRIVGFQVKTCPGLALSPPRGSGTCSPKLKSEGSKCQCGSACELSFVLVNLEVTC